MNGSVQAARAAGLRWVRDDERGIQRETGPLGFRYRSSTGRLIGDAALLRRIRSLVIPPAWTDVWICTDVRGHIQATGRDARGRKQYRYHPEWRTTRDETKFHRMREFAAVLSRIRARTALDLARPGLPRAKVLATVVQLLEKSLIRVGNDEYARANRSFGLTTLKDKHVAVKGSTLRFEFRGKSGKRHVVDVSDHRLARIVRQCRELPGQELFQYLDERGVRRDVTSSDVNAYLRDITGTDFTAKDFRTWTATVLTATALAARPPCAVKAHVKRNIVRAVEAVAGVLGNTPAVCRKSYIHPAIFEAYVDGGFPRPPRRPPRTASRLKKEEVLALAILQRRPRPALLTAA